MSTPDDIEGYVAGLKVAELREELKKLNQPLHGNKAALGQRLREALEKKREGEQEAEEEEEEEEEEEAATEEEAAAPEVDGGAAAGGNGEVSQEPEEAVAEEAVAEVAEEKQSEGVEQQEDGGEAGGAADGEAMADSAVEPPSAAAATGETDGKEEPETDGKEEPETEDKQPTQEEAGGDERVVDEVGGDSDVKKDETMDTTPAGETAGGEDRKRPRDDEEERRRERRERPDPTKAPDPEDPSEEFSEESVTNMVQEGSNQFEAPEDDTTITLDTFNSDLYFKIGSDGLTGQGLTQQGFAYLWAAAKATWGAKGGKVFFEIKVVENITIVDLSDTEEHPNALRVGWSVGDAGLGLGEAPLSYGFGSTGKGVVNNQYNEYGEVYGAGDIITCLMDLESSPPSISFAKNGTHLGIAFTLDEERIKGHSFFPHVTTKNVVVRLNFCEPLLQSLPEGFEGYIPLQTIGVENKQRAMFGPNTVAECEVIMMVGLPASGKTTWAEKHMRENPEKRYTILGTNQIMDKMKVSGLTRRGNYHGRWELLIKKATDILNRLLVMAGKTPRNYIIDQTNVYAKAQNRKMGYFEGFVRKAVVVIPPHHELRKRTAQRTKEMGDPVPEDALNAMRANFHVPVKDNLFDEVIFTEIYGQAAQKIIQQYKDDALGLPSYPQNKRGRYDRYDRPPGPPGRFGPPRGGPYGSPSYRGSYGSGPGYRGGGGYMGSSGGGYGYRPMYPPYGPPAMYGGPPPPPRRGSFGYGSPPGPPYGGGRSPYGYGPPPPSRGYYGRY